ncbi:hypothetical protein P154DRAFT_618338 [Amniculicola lignicola CBS 123094]|uniref:Uncharacterized protein n=1 Tax=Amniculicola lignicola CBS 123094 TaxID=1392246 RepID=A0A6A5WY39_9PLEO|nr:hypothetical protein P154DRAFT_618338 [Amniculicola lignicola CBS 123094]
MASSKARHDPKGISPLEVIFSCSVCYETLPQIYAGHPETVGGLSDGINPTHRLVSRVYLASCCHVICIKHIGDGEVEAGPAFFKKGDRPTAPCPVCIKEKGDAQPRELYSVRGFRKGQYDPVIPACWFDTPPMKLEVSSTEMEALRFHYVSLLRYGKQVTALREQDKQELAVTKQNCRSLEATAAEQQEKILALEQEVQRLSAAEDRLTKYEKRMPEIRSHLQILPTLVEQNKAMKERLAMLGYSMLNQPIRYDKIPMDNGANILQDIPESAPTLRGETAASPAAVRPGTFTNKVGSIPYPSDFSSRPQKRQRVESPLLEHNIHAEQYNNGRSAMPPPPRPLSRMKSLKKFIPTLRKRSGTSGNTPGRLEEGNDVQVLQDGRVATIGLPTRFTAGTTRPSARLEFIQRSPLSRAFQEAPQSAVRNPPPIVTEEDMDDDLYRPPTPYASKQAQSAQSPPTLPHDRSYIHIMDGITPGSPDLAIRDPRHSFDFEYGRNDEAGPSAIPQSPTKRWSLGHPFLHQSPTQAPNERGAKPLPGLPEHRADPVTPAPKRISQQSTEVESVTSATGHLSIAKGENNDQGGA